jgi:DnaJ-class molecular chaperone
MKTYDVLCKTCGGTGFIHITNSQTTSATEICPVCKGSKTQKIHETSSIQQNKRIMTMYPYS